jgi:hypothetical protein
MDLIVAVLIPMLAVLYCLYRDFANLRINLPVFTYSSVGGAVMALPPAQSLLHFMGQPETDIVVVPLFLGLYPLIGRFNLPSYCTAYAGTFLSLLFADLIAASYSAVYQIPWWKPFLWIGGYGISDGLVLLPIGALLPVFLIRYAIKQGYSLRLFNGKGMC